MTQFHPVVNEKVAGAYAGLAEQAAKTAQLTWQWAAGGFNTVGQVAQGYQAEATRLQRSLATYMGTRTQVLSDVGRASAKLDALDPMQSALTAQEALEKLSAQDLALLGEVRETCSGHVERLTAEVAAAQQPFEALLSAQQQLAAHAFAYQEALVEAYYDATFQLVKEPIRVAQQAAGTAPLTPAPARKRGAARS